LTFISPAEAVVQEEMNNEGVNNNVS